jgi:hypothetical protein
MVDRRGARVEHKSKRRDISLSLASGEKKEEERRLREFSSSSSAEAHSQPFFRFQPW